MRLIPAILILVSFGIICFGLYLQSQHYAIAIPVIFGGLLGEAIFINWNRYLMRKSKKQ